MYILPSLPVRHQGLRDTCTAFTGASIAEYNYPLDGRLSPEFIYYQHHNTMLHEWQELIPDISKKRHSH